MQPLQADLTKKIQQARQAGYNDEQIRSYIAQKYPTSQRQQATAPVKQGGRGGTATSLISEASGAGGAAIGGAIGTALLPGIGTVIGAGLGGLLGGSGGSAVEQQVRDGKVNTRKALTEGAIEGLFSAGPLKLIKGGKAAAKSIKAGSRGLSLVDDISEALVGNVTKAGRAATAGARGVTTGVKLSGDRITPKTAREINEFLTKEVKARATAPEGQLDDLAKYQKKLYDQLDNTVNKFNKTIGDKDRIFLMNKLGKSFNSKIAGASQSQRELAAQLAKEISQKGSLKDLNDYVKLLDTQINFNRPMDAVSAQREQVFKLVRNELRDTLTDPDVIPGLKGVKSKLSKAYQAEDLLLEAAGKTGSPINPLGARVPNRLIQGAQARAGKTLEKTGGALDSTSNRALITRALLGGSAASAINSSGQEAGQLEQTDPTFVGNLTGEQDLMTQLNEALGQTPAQQQPQQTGGLTQEDINQAILLDLQETGGKNVEQIQMIAELYGPQASQAADPNITKVTAQQYGLAQTGFDSLQNLKNILQTDPNVLSRSRTPGRDIGLLGIGGTITNAAGTGDFDAVGYNIADTLLRLRTGATANESEVKKLQSQIMPRAGDSPQTVATKIAQLEAAFASILDIANSGAGQKEIPVGLQ